MANVGDIILTLLGAAAGAASPAAGRGLAVAGRMAGERSRERQRQEAIAQEEQRRAVLGQTISSMLQGQGPQETLVRSLAERDADRAIGPALALLNAQESASRPRPGFTEEDALAAIGGLPPNVSRSYPMQTGGTMSGRGQEPPTPEAEPTLSPATRKSFAMQLWGVGLPGEEAEQRAGLPAGTLPPGIRPDLVRKEDAAVAKAEAGAHKEQVSQLEKAIENGEKNLEKLSKQITTLSEPALKAMRIVQPSPYQTQQVMAFRNATTRRIELENQLSAARRQLKELGGGQVAPAPTAEARPSPSVGSGLAGRVVRGEDGKLRLVN